MIDPWDDMIASDDATSEAEIAADLAAYTKWLGRGETDACIRIEKKYGLFGHTPEAVSTILAEMAKPAQGGAA